MVALIFFKQVGHLCLLHLPPTTSDRRPGRRLHRLPTTSENPWNGDCTVYLPPGRGGGSDFLQASRSLMPFVSSTYHLRLPPGDGHCTFYLPPPEAAAGLTFFKQVGHLCLLHLPPTTPDRLQGAAIAPSTYHADAAAGLKFFLAGGPHNG